MPREMGEVMRRHHETYGRHPSVGAVRNIGLFGMIDVVRSRAPSSRWRRTTARPTR